MMKSMIKLLKKKFPTARKKYEKKSMMKNIKHLLKKRLTSWRLKIHEKLTSALFSCQFFMNKDPSVVVFGGHFTFLLCVNTLLFKGGVEPIRFEKDFYALSAEEQILEFLKKLKWWNWDPSKQPIPVTFFDVEYYRSIERRYLTDQTFKELFERLLSQDKEWPKVLNGENMFQYLDREYEHKKQLYREAWQQFHEKWLEERKLQEQRSKEMAEQRRTLDEFNKKFPPPRKR